MSDKDIQWARLRGLGIKRRASRATLMVLARNANDAGEVTMTWDNLARETGYCRRTIATAIPDLVASGVVTHEKIRRGWTWITRFELNTGPAAGTGS